MDIGKTLYVTDRKSWRGWLGENCENEKEIWLVFYKKDSGKPRISYDDAVLEALAYGWIDSIVKKVDDQSFAQRFSPRRPTSGLSQMNKERVRELIKTGQMTKAGLDAIAHVYDPKTDPYFVKDPKGKMEEELVISAGILKSLKANKEAWDNFQKLPESYKRIRVAYIESRKRHGVAMYQSALKHFVKMTALNKRLGFVKERK